MSGLGCILRSRIRTDGKRLVDMILNKVPLVAFGPLLLSFKLHKENWNVSILNHCFDVGLLQKDRLKR